MGQYKEEDLSRWRGLVSEQVASGKSVSAFCRERGLRVWPFYEWKKRLRKPDAAAFVSIEISREPLHSPRFCGVITMQWVRKQL
jgi:hypothetical protein